MTKLPVSNPELNPKFFWFHLKPEQINWVLGNLGNIGYLGKTCKTHKLWET